MHDVPPFEVAVCYNFKAGLIGNEELVILLPINVVEDVVASGGQHAFTQATRLMSKQCPNLVGQCLAKVFTNLSVKREEIFKPLLLDSTEDSPESFDDTFIAMVLDVSRAFTTIAIQGVELTEKDDGLTSMNNQCHEPPYFAPPVQLRFDYRALFLRKSSVPEIHWAAFDLEHTLECLSEMAVEQTFNCHLAVIDSNRVRATEGHPSTGNEPPQDCALSSSTSPSCTSSIHRHL
ncbi:unnamed protein product [Taenia asiatica]|uniref:Uncharacterized protein n=1 Tax=Taenia asiatica TaxID=60517 RepID=A0A0R3VVS0_TAEAS|nr:unnamed protein product [Taenia asiatica]